MRINTVRLIFALLTLSFLSGCSPTPPKNVPVEPNASMNTEALEAYVADLVLQARNASTAERPALLMRAASTLLQNGESDWAYNLLQSIDAYSIGDYSYLEYADLYTQAAIGSGHFINARNALKAPRLNALWEQLPSAKQSELLARQASVESLLGDYKQSLEARFALGQQLTDNQLRDENNQAIWSDLLHLPLQELDQLQQGAPTTQRGWAELAYISRNNAANLSQQLQQVQQWQKRWPEHPASIQLPSDLQLLHELIAQQPRQIALLLPQKGRLAGAAEAVRDGFLSAYFNQSDNEQRPIVRHYDTSTEDINSIFDRAISEGAELVIGPLAKEQVEIIAQREQLPVPVLALNYREATATATAPEADSRPMPAPLAAGPTLFTPSLYQFGLAAEDEAAQIAQFAYLQGHKRAMIIAPDIDWAERSVARFEQEWRSKGGAIVLDSRYIGAGDFSEVIKTAMLIQDSELRHRQLRDIILTNMEFEPRRRSDIDVIFLIATPTEARQIKPTLAFHYAGDIPVIATSQIYTGEDNPKGDRDLNGIRFSSLPWLFSDEEEARDIHKFADAPASYNRLHALGADAFHLYQRLPQLSRLPQTRVDGATGSLQLNSDNRIVRQAIWAEFRNGVAERLAMQSIIAAEND